MKFYPKLIVFSTLLTFSHFLFANASSQVEWLVWDTSQSLAGFSVLAAWVMYVSTPYYRIGLKLFTAIYFVLCWVSPVCWVINGNHHSLVVQLSILAFAGLYWLLKASQWNLSNIHQGEVNQGAYIVFKRPNKFISWLASLFGFGIGSCFIVVNGKKYAMSKKHSEVIVMDFIKLHPDEFAYEIDGITEIGLKMFQKDCDELVGQKFNLINRNCLTVFRKVLIKFGVRPRTILPSIYFGEFIR